MAWIFYALIALFFGYLLYDAFGKPVGRTKPEPRQRSEERRREDKPAPEVDEPYEPYAYTVDAVLSYRRHDLDQAMAIKAALFDHGMNCVLVEEKDNSFDRYWGVRYCTMLPVSYTHLTLPTIA